MRTRPAATISSTDITTAKTNAKSGIANTNANSSQSTIGSAKISRSKQKELKKSAKRSDIVDLIEEESSNKRKKRARNNKKADKPVSGLENPLLAKIAELQRMNETLKKQCDKERTDNKENEKKRKKVEAQEAERLKELMEEVEAAEKEKEKNELIIVNLKEQISRKEVPKSTKGDDIHGDTTKSILI